MADEVMVHSVDALAYSRVVRGEAYAYDRAILVPGDGTSKCCVQVYSLLPGKANYPFHWHEGHEEVFYIIAGEGLLETPDGERPVRPGDVIVCPTGPGGAHKLTNPGQAPLVYLEVDAVAFPEVAGYPRADGMAVLYGDRQRNRFFIGSRQVSYDELCERG